MIKKVRRNFVLTTLCGALLMVMLVTEITPGPGETSVPLDIDQWHQVSTNKLSEATASTFKHTTIGANNATKRIEDVQTQKPPKNKPKPGVHKNKKGDFSENVQIFLKEYERDCAKQKVPNTSDLPVCSCIPPLLVGRRAVDVDTIPSMAEVASSNTEVQPGGYWKPSKCYTRDRVLIIIPFRDRQPHLRILLKYLHPLLQKQQIEYRIFIVEQASPDLFNKASLMNAGYLEAKKLFNFDCVIFHDVDLISEDDRNFYTCLHSPRHLAPYLKKWNYSLPFEIFGGAIMLKKDEFERANGFANRFFGWGGEDDDMLYRVKNIQRMKIYRYPTSTYTMVEHERDVRNPENEERYKILRQQTRRNQQDGLKTVKYTVRNTTITQLFTWMFVELTPLFVH